MSEYWTLKCNTCNIECEERVNHLEKVLLNVLQLSNEFKKIKDADSMNYIEIHVMSHGTQFVDFIVEHYGHDIVVMSEYEDYITKDGIKHKKGE